MKKDKYIKITCFFSWRCEVISSSDLFHLLNLLRFFLHVRLSMSQGKWQWHPWFLSPRNLSTKFILTIEKKSLESSVWEITMNIGNCFSKWAIPLSWGVFKLLWKGRVLEKNAIWMQFFVCLCKKINFVNKWEGTQWCWFSFLKRTLTIVSFQF